MRIKVALGGGVRFQKLALTNGTCGFRQYAFVGNAVVTNSSTTPNQRTSSWLPTPTRRFDGCAAGSWDPDQPAKEIWGPQGGRLMVTALSALALETYYRYLPIYKTQGTNPETAAQPRGRTH